MVLKNVDPRNHENSVRDPRQGGGQDLGVQGVDADQGADALASGLSVDVGFQIKSRLEQLYLFCCSSSRNRCYKLLTLFPFVFGLVHSSTKTDFRNR